MGVVSVPKLSSHPLRHRSTLCSKLLQLVMVMMVMMVMIMVVMRMMNGYCYQRVVFVVKPE